MHQLSKFLFEEFDLDFKFAGSPIDQHVIRRDAGLPGVEPLAGGQPRGGFIQREIATDNRRRLAAQLQRDRHQMLGGSGHHLAANSR